MSAQENAKNWKGRACAALAKFYAVKAEQEEFETKLEAAREECRKAGISFRYSHSEPDMPSASAALICPCGTVVPLDWDNERVPRTAGVLHCAACREKAATAAREDAIAEGRPDPAAPTPKAAPITATKPEEIPF